MELCVFISDIRHLEHLTETLEIAAKPSPDYLEIMDSDLKVNQTSLTRLKKYFQVEMGKLYSDDIERIYFGAETCEYLIPTLSDVQKALKYCQENEYGFTLVTPYGGPRAMQKIRELLQFLSDKEDIEIVVNDFGALHMVIEEFKNLKPVIGRLLIKMKRDPRFSISGYDIANANLKNISRVEGNQSEALQNSSFENELVQHFLAENNVSRLGVDSVPQGFNKKIIKKWKLPVDIYWPWTYITSGRNCTIAAHTDASRAYHLTEKPCQKQCKMYEFRFESDKHMFLTVQRGNAVWMNSETNHEEYFKAGFERLVFMPYIPV